MITDTKRPRAPRPSEIAGRIDAAADLLATNGWCRGTYDKGDRHCAVGAIVAVTSDRGWRFATLKALSDYVEHRAPEFGDVTDWNDAQRDKRKVIRWMRACANELRNNKRKSNK